jgi:hypothetical protein
VTKADLLQLRLDIRSDQERDKAEVKADQNRAFDKLEASQMKAEASQMKAIDGLRMEIKKDVEEVKMEVRAAAVLGLAFVVYSNARFIDLKANQAEKRKADGAKGWFRWFKK